jgi:hypothetical protein
MISYSRSLTIALLSVIFVSLNASLAIAQVKNATGTATKKAAEKGTDEELEKKLKERLDKLFEKRAKEQSARLTYDQANSEHEAIKKTVKERNKIEKLKLSLDLPIVESPALMGIGLTPTIADLAQSPREMSIATPLGIDLDGNFQIGVALNFAPMQLMLRHWLDSADYADTYRAKYWYRLINRIQISFAQSRGLSDLDEASRLSLGMRIVLFDLGDPQLDAILEGDVEDSIAAPLSSVKEGKKGGDVDEQRIYLRTAREARRRYDDEVPERLSKVRGRARQRNALRSRLAIGWSPSWISREGEVNKLKSNGGAAWMTFAYGFDAPRSFSTPWLKKYFQLITHARYRHDEDAAGPVVEGRFYERTGFLFSWRLRSGYKDFYASFETALVTTRPKRQRFKRDTYYVFSGSVEYRVRSNLWLQATVGAEGRRDLLENESFFLFTFRFGVL